jgi:hypothetical protein
MVPAENRTGHLPNINPTLYPLTQVHSSRVYGSDFHMPLEQHLYVLAFLYTLLTYIFRWEILIRVKLSLL